VAMALLSISEFGRATGLSVSALRFYDAVGLIDPAHVDEANGYRRYSADQAETAGLIRDLRRLEMPIFAIRTFLGAPAQERHQMLDQHLASLSSRLQELEELANVVRTILGKGGAVSSMTVGAAELGGAIDQVAPAAGSDPERPLLQTVLVEARDGSLRLVASDSYRLAVRDLVARDGETVSFRAVVAAARLVRAKTELPPDGELEVSFEGRTIKISGPATEIDLGVVPAEYPDYEQLFGSDPEASSFTAERAALAEILASKHDHKAVLLELRASDVRVGDDRVPVIETWDGPDMTVAINPRFFDYAVGSAVGPEIRVEISTPLKPVLFRAATDGSFICLVMPVKLD
jgi:DNA polymerase-3 subunit beta